MIKRPNPDQMEIKFDMPFGKLNSENRWIKLSSIIPWDDFSTIYESAMNGQNGAPSIPARIAVGALILKHLTGQTDEEIIESIRENPYFQYFLGLEHFTDKQVFTPSLFVAIRKRLGSEGLEEINNRLHKQQHPSDGIEATTERGDKKREACFSLSL